MYVVNVGWFFWVIFVIHQRKYVVFSLYQLVWMSVPANKNFIFIWFQVSMCLFIFVCIPVNETRFTWMVCHIMHTHQHRREGNLHFSNSFMEKSLLIFLTASERHHHGLGGTGGCLCMCQKNVEKSKIPAVCWDGAGLAGVSLHRFCLPRFFVRFCACEKLQQTLCRASSSCWKQKVKGQLLLVSNSRCLSCARHGWSLFPAGVVLTSALAECASAPWE